MQKMQQSACQFEFTAAHRDWKCRTVFSRDWLNGVSLSINPQSQKLHQGDELGIEKTGSHKLGQAQNSVNCIPVCAIFLRCITLTMTKPTKLKPRISGETTVRDSASQRDGRAVEPEKQRHDSLQVLRVKTCHGHVINGHASFESKRLRCTAQRIIIST